MDEIWLIQYSVSQSAFHVDRLDRALKRNLEQVRTCLSMGRDSANDYLPVGAAPSFNEASALADGLSKAIKR